MHRRSTIPIAVDNGLSGAHALTIIDFALAVAG
jgi:hypothetical protein